MKNTIQYCPCCDYPLEAKNINISEGVALCPKCGELSQLSNLNFSGSTTEEALSKKSKRTKLRSDTNQIKVTFYLFSFPKFVVSLAISIFWNGIVSVFLSLAVAAVFYNFVGFVPEWLPAPGLEDGQPIMNDEVMGVGMTLFLCAFLTPFVVIGMGMIINTLLRLCGTSNIVIKKHRSYVSTGIAFIQRKKYFEAHEVDSVKCVLAKSDEGNQERYEIEIISGKKMKFGSLLSEAQLNWASAFLKVVLIQKRGVGVIERLHWL